ncbi:MAG: LPS export ABC transporter permease LptF [Candidatus Binatia bacterium]|nr:MAG: LPS export ABC transporter permease LptF [Candidatus Binatia bacterium]
MSTIGRYVVREISGHFLAASGVVLGVFVVQRLTQLLGEAAAGELPSDVVFTLLGIRALVALPSLLPATFYLAVVLALGRLYADNEMTALAACGVPPRRVAASVLGFAAVFSLVVAALSFFVRPWAAGEFDRVRRQAVARVQLRALEAGRFYEVGPEGRKVLFAESRSRKEGTMRRVFLQDRTDGRISVFVSDRAVEYLDPETGYRFLTLLDGRRYDLRPGPGKFEITRFRRLVVRTDLASTARSEPESPRVVATSILLRSARPQDRAEFEWRVALPVHAFLLALVAIPLARVDPRRGKFGKVAAAVLAYVAYRQALGTAKRWIADGLLPPVPGLWLVHALWLAGAGAYLALRRKAGEDGFR